MSETTVTLVGNAATGVDYRETVNGPVARFRMAVTPRRWDRGRSVWTDGPTSFYTVSAWRGLAANVSGSVSVGDPLVVHGRLRVREVDLRPEAGERAAGGSPPGGSGSEGPWGRQEPGADPGGPGQGPGQGQLPEGPGAGRQTDGRQADGRRAAGRPGDASRRTYVDIEAIAVGHDLNRGTSAFRRAARATTGVAVPASVL
ncbi:single-stranded DNA-binding protein [Streptomyces sp. NPDC003691]